MPSERQDQPWKDATACRVGGHGTGDIGTDILTYARSQGLFAGVSLSGAPSSLTTREQALYGKDLTRGLVIKRRVTARRVASRWNKLLTA